MSIQKLVTIVIVSACLVLFGLSNPGNAGKATGVLNIGVGADVVQFDPALQKTKNSAEVILHICERILGFDQNYNFIPMVAERWEILDPKTYRFYIRKGVKFHDGTPCNAAAVKYSLARVLDPKTGSVRRIYFEMIDKMEVVDEHTLDIFLKYPFGPFLNHLAHPTSAIVSPKAAEELGLDKFGLQPVGTGPYKFKSWRKGEEVVLERFDDYWGGRPKLKEIRFKIIRESGTRMIALETGEIDIAKHIPPHEADRLKKVTGIKVEAFPTPRTMYLAFNCQEKPFDNKTVRKALYHAIDTEGMVKAIFGEYGLPPTGGVIAPWLFGGREQPLEYDTEKAKKLLAQAGYSRGFSTELWTPHGRYPMDKQVATLVASQLENNLGIKVNVKVFEFATYIKKLKSRSYKGMILMGWGNSTGDADSSLYGTFHSSQRKGTRNLANYNSPEVDKLMEEARRITDRDVRRKTYHKILDTIQDDAPWRPLYLPITVYGMKENVEGFAEVLEHLEAQRTYFK